jgi:hypothetical protein
LLREINDVIKGNSMMAIDIARTIRSKYNRIPPDAVTDLSGCGDIDLRKSNLNIHICKMLTGGDKLAGKVSDQSVTLKSSVKSHALRMLLVNDEDIRGMHVIAGVVITRHLRFTRIRLAC